MTDADPVTGPGAEAGTFALLTDGSTVEIRSARPQDAVNGRVRVRPAEPADPFLRRLR
jgi:hypothetical protein